MHVGWFRHFGLALEIVPDCIPGARSAASVPRPK